jgi:brefeldin A-inhibited guanine nucleotide-exchange protein
MFSVDEEKKETLSETTEATLSTDVSTSSDKLVEGTLATDVPNSTDKFVVESTAEGLESSVKGTPDDMENDGGKGSSLTFPSILHKDAFLIFRALCKLSMKGLHEDSNNQYGDQIALQNK